MSQLPPAPSTPSFDKSDFWWNAHDVAASLIPPGSRVLDVGCGWGHVAERVVRNGGRVVGVEPDPERRARAAQWCEAIHEAFAEQLHELDLEPGSFDVVTFTDVLEHLIDPWTTLHSTLRYLRPGGRVVISVPNMANYGVRLNLLKGEFRYQDSGLYDRTHLRFFTEATLIDLVRQAGLDVVAWRYTPNLTETGVYRRTLRRIPGLHGLFRQIDLRLTYRFPRLFCCQFIIACETVRAAEVDTPGSPGYI